MENQNDVYMHFPQRKVGKIIQPAICTRPKSIKFSFHFEVILCNVIGVLGEFPNPRFLHFLPFCLPFWLLPLTEEIMEFHENRTSRYRSTLPVGHCTKRALALSKGKVGYPWKNTRDIYQQIPPSSGLYNGRIEEYGQKKLGPPNC